MNDQPKCRTRSYSWVALEEKGAPTSGRSGLEYYQAIKDGALPQQPIAATIGWRVTDVVKGRVCLELDCGEHLMHAAGCVHGGILSILLDGATAAAVMTTVPPGARCSTLQLSVQYLATVREGVDVLFAEGSVSHRGNRVCAAEGLIRDAENKVYARATATLMISEKTAHSSQA